MDRGVPGQSAAPGALCSAPIGASSRAVSSAVAIVAVAVASNTAAKCGAAERATCQLVGQFRWG